MREAIIQYRGRGRKIETPIRMPLQAVAFARRAVLDHAREHFVALYLDARHRPVSHAIVSVGTATAALVHPREVFQTAVLSGAVAFVVLHNHPSGDLNPSREDETLTTRLRDAGELIGVRLIDSIVWAHGTQGYVSFRERQPELFG